ncbi:MAG: hypothetical protein FWC60_09745, partial [Firmicutes bacterium]|nr:hypothetical protein [Bacillota bacterium]
MNAININVTLDASQELKNLLLSILQAFQAAPSHAPFTDRTPVTDVTPEPAPTASAVPAKANETEPAITAPDTPAPKQAPAAGQGEKDWEKMLVDLRSLAATKIQGGKRDEVKALLQKYNIGQVSAVTPKDYQALYDE